MNSRAILLSGTLLLSLTNLAQNFDGFNYQAVVRNASGDPLPSQAVGVQVIIVSGILQPHVEVHSVTTDAHGLMKLVIGEGQLQSGPAFSAIDWSDNTAWTCCVAVDITGGTNYAVLGCETFKAVPFALRALTSDSGPPTGWSLNGPMLSNTNAGNVGIGTTSPSAKLDVEGSFQLKDGSQGAQRILTSDADGNASWSNLSAESIFGSGNVPGGDISCLSSASTIATGTGPQSVAVAGNYAYVVNEGSSNLQVFDVSDPAAPSLSATIATDTYPKSVAVSGNYAYVVNRVSGTLQVFDVSNPTMPGLTATVAAGSVPWIVAVAGNYAFVLTNQSHLIMVFDVSNPAAPGLIATISPAGVFVAMAVAGTYLYASDYVANTMQVFDVSNPSAPGLIATIDAAGSCEAIAVAGTYVYALNPNASTMQVFDVSNPSAPSLSATIPSYSIVPTLAVAGNYAFVLEAASDNMKVFDVSNPSAPSLSATIATGDYPNSVAVVGNYAYVVNANSNNMQVFNLFCPNMITMDPVTGELTSQAITESDPQVGANTTDRVPKWDGNALVSGTIADVAGKVGIGTTTPDAKLTIGTPGQTWTDYGITSDSRFGVVNGPGGRLAAILSSSASGGRLESWDYAADTWAPILISPFGGNVGIGTTTPSAKLEVVGSFKLNDGNQAPGKVLTSDANGNATWSTPSAGTGWALNGTNLYNTNIGNVGLGTTAPVARLDVSGSGWFRADANSLPTSAGKGVRVFYDQTYDVGQIFSHDYSTGTPSNIILQGPGGNVGIGTTTPEDKLDVNGQARIKEHLTFNSANGVVNWGPSGSLFFRTLNAVGDISGYNDRMVIAANGNVGIGTTAPSANLEVVGSFKINDGNQAAGKVLTSDASGIASWQAMPSITSGTYTPTWVTISGFTTAPTFLGCTYSKVGAIVTVVCSIGGAGPVYSTGTNSATITVPTDLPIANPAGGPRVCGTFSSGYHESGTETSTGFVLRSNTTKVLLKMNGSNYAGIAGTWCSFTYATSAP